MSSQPTHSDLNVSAHCTPQRTFSKDDDKSDPYKQEIPATQYIQKLTKDVRSVHAGPEHLVCIEFTDGEESLGQLAQIFPTEYYSCTVPRPKMTLHPDKGCMSTLGASGGPKEAELLSEQMKLKCDASSQTRLTLQGTNLIFSEETPLCRSSGELVVQSLLSQPSNLNFEPPQGSSHTLTDTLNHHKAGEGSSDQNSCSDPIQPCPHLMQPVDRLPTFTSQKSLDVRSAMGKWTPNEHRYVWCRFNKSFT